MDIVEPQTPSTTAGGIAIQAKINARLIIQCAHTTEIHGIGAIGRGDVDGWSRREGDAIAAVIQSSEAWAGAARQKLKDHLNPCITHRSSAECEVIVRCNVERTTCGKSSCTPCTVRGVIHLLGTCQTGAHICATHASGGRGLGCAYGPFERPKRQSVIAGLDLRPNLIWLRAHDLEASYQAQHQ